LARSLGMLSAFEELRIMSIIRSEAVFHRDAGIFLTASSTPIMHNQQIPVVRHTEISISDTNCGSRNPADSTGRHKERSDAMEFVASAGLSSAFLDKKSHFSFELDTKPLIIWWLP